jgi:hypothetical protein
MIYIYIYPISKQLQHILTICTASHQLQSHFIILRHFLVTRIFNG